MRMHHSTSGYSYNCLVPRPRKLGLGTYRSFQRPNLIGWGVTRSQTSLRAGYDVLISTNQIGTIPKWYHVGFRNAPILPHMHVHDDIIGIWQWLVFPGTSWRLVFARLSPLIGWILTKWSGWWGPTAPVETTGEDMLSSTRIGMVFYHR